MTTLTVLSTQEIEDYINALNLSEGGEAYRVLDTMMLLPTETFIRAISALAQGLIGTSDIRALPGINALLVERLLTSRLANNDEAALAYKYRAEWFPATVNTVTLQAGAVTPAANFMASKFFDFGTYVVKPQYDVLGTDETKFKTYRDAYSGYIRAASGAVAKKAVQDFLDLHVLFKAANPSLVQADDADNPVYKLISSLQTNAIFLEQPDGRNAANFGQDTLLSWILRGVFEFISYGDYKAFFDEAYVKMAQGEGSDPGHTGGVGALAMYNLYPIVPVAAEGFAKDLVYAWLARVHLARVYGSQVVTQDVVKDNLSSIGRILSYLRAARVALRTFRAAITSDARPPSVAGQPFGMLLALTNAPGLDAPVERFSNALFRDPATGNEAPGSPFGLLLALTHV